MDATLKKSGVTLVVIGLLFMPLAPLAGGLIESDSIRRSAALATTFGLAMFVYGCIRIAVAKGQPWYVGLLGLFNIIGLAILWFVVPDKRGSTSAAG
jgi:hypothetical protein